MNVSEAIRARRSIRAYRKTPVEKEKLDRILEAGRLSPSARNMQERHFVVVTDKDKRHQLVAAANNQSFVGQAPVVIAACGTIPDYVMACGQTAYTVDVAIAVDHMSLQAMEEGLGTCWVCAFKEPAVKEVLNIPENLRVVTLLTLGYPAENPDPRPRNPIEDMVSYETYE